MKLFKRITATALGMAVLSTSAFAAEYNLGKLKKFYSFEDYSTVYTQSSSSKVLPDGFVDLSTGGFAVAPRGFGIDETRGGKAFRFGTYRNEFALKFGAAVDSGMLHISYDVYQDYDESKPLSKGKTLWLMLSRNADGYVGTGNVNGVVTDNATFKNDDPEALAFDKGYQSVLDHGTVAEWEDDGNMTPTKKTPVAYFSNSTGLEGTRGYDSEGKTIDWKQWRKVDVFIDKDNCTFEAYLDGELIEGISSYGSGAATSVAATLVNNDSYNYTKGLVFRAQTPYINGARPSMWEGSNSYFALDNVYVKNYTGDNDIVSIVSDDASGNGVALSGGTVNIAFSEFMNGAATAENVSVTNTATGDTVTDFTIEKSNGMQFVINFGGRLDAGQYRVDVNGLKSKISGQEVSVPAYFDTAADGKIWVKDVKCLRNDGVAQERGLNVTSGTTAVDIDFSSAVSVTSENAGDYIEFLDKDGNSVDIKSFEVSDDKKTVTVNPTYLFEPGTDYMLKVKDTLPTENGVMVSDSDGSAIEEVISIANDPHYEYSQSFDYDQDSKQAQFKVTMVKSDTSTVKYTIVAASYKDVKDESGNVIGTEMIDVEYVPISLNEDERVLRDYVTANVDCDGADKVKAFVWEYPSFKKVYKFEQEL